MFTARMMFLFMGGIVRGRIGLLWGKGKKCCDGGDDAAGQVQRLTVSEFLPRLTREEFSLCGRYAVTSSRNMLDQAASGGTQALQHGLGLEEQPTISIEDTLRSGQDMILPKSRACVITAFSMARPAGLEPAIQFFRNLVLNFLYFKRSEMLTNVIDVVTLVVTYVITETFREFTLLDCVLHAA